MTFNQVQSGDKLRISAREWNAVRAATLAHEQQVFELENGKSGLSRQLSRIKVKYTSAAARSKYDVVQLTAPLIAPATKLETFKEPPVWTAEAVPASFASVTKPVILLQAAKQNDYAWAAIGGVCQVQVKYNAPANRFADFLPGDSTKLQTMHGGPLEILWLESVSDGATAWALVRFCDYRRVVWRNTHASTCPAHGVFRVSDSVYDGAGSMVGARPSSSFARVYFVNDVMPVAQDQWGVVQVGTRPIVACEGLAAIGEGWGPKPDQWTLAKNYPQTATVQSALVNGVNNYLCDWKPIDTLIGKADATIALGTSGNISIWGGAAGGEIDLGLDISGCARGHELGAAKWSSGSYINSAWYFGPWEC